MTEAAADAAAVEVWFYHLTRAPLVRALPDLVGKVLASGRRGVLRTTGSTRIGALSDMLWTADDAGWLPHGSAEDGHAERQPLWLTADDGPPPNGADILILVDGAAPATEHLARFARVLDMFDGTDEAATTAARARWQAARAAGFDLAYWQQAETGGWRRAR